LKVINEAMMRRSQAIYAFLLLALPILYWFYQQPSNAQSSEDLRACIAEFEKIRVEAAKIKPVNLFPFLQGYQQLGYRDKKGEVIIPPRFTEARNFSQGRAVVADRNWYKGFINSKGELIIPHKFVWVSDFSKEIAVFSGTKENREQKGLIDLRGNIVLTLRVLVLIQNLMVLTKMDESVYMCMTYQGGTGTLFPRSMVTLIAQEK
jgi:hypothetical protein